MLLNNPVFVQPPSITNSDGTVKTFDPIVFDKLDITITDNIDRKICVARICGLPWPMLLWRGESYDQIGDYTQAQVEAKIMEKLGDDPKSVLESLFIRPTQDS